MKIRIAETADAEAMSQILQAIVAATGRERPSGIDFVAPQPPLLTRPRNLRALNFLGSP